MSEFYGGLDRAYIAGEAIEKGQIVALDDSDSGKVNVCDAATAALVIGIATEPAAAAGDTVNVRIQGIAEVLCGEIVAASDILCAGVDGGKAQKYDDAGTNYIVGKATTGAALNGYAECVLAIGSA